MAIQPGQIVHLKHGETLPDVMPMNLPPSVELAKSVFDALNDRERSEVESKAYETALVCLYVFLNTGPLWIQTETH